NPEHLAQLETWMREYRAEELFDERGGPIAEIRELAPAGNRRMSANPHANGGLLMRDLAMPGFRADRAEVPQPGASFSEATRVLGAFLRDMIRENPEIFRLFGPDETVSNRLSAVFEATDRQWLEERIPIDDHLAPSGRVIEVLSEHLCQ